MQAKYTHTNLIAVDWRTLAKFYIEVLDCELVPPERDLRGEPVERGTAIPGVHLSGVHLRLPGVGSDGPTLEIFSYEPLAAAAAKKVNRPGFGHIAFAVEDIDAARAEVLAHGGRAVGELVKTPIGDTGHYYRWCYLTDPEGNILELQVKE
ncbi:MAG: VOC family protein [Anaerolineaceae bacterium]|nr:VOC family protein [Anaerolineaceae bacterium]